MQQKKVLIVEDEGVVALSLQSILTKMGYTVVGNAITGDEAIALARDHHPDVILMDIHIKGSLDGIQTTEKINEFSDVPVIYLTAYADDETVSRAIKTRSHSYLVKPVNQRELYSNIEFAIYKRRLRDRAGTSQENLELFLTNIKEAGFIINLKNRIVFSNSAAEVLTGYKAEEMKEMNFFDLMNLAPSQRGDAGDETIQKILDLEAIDYLPPIATFSAKSGKRRTALIRAGMIREDKDEHKNVFILVKEMDPADYS
ncbi:MAG: response regulator [Methanoregula sp.]|jgi:PAS domain S-box-containing protein